MFYISHLVVNTPLTILSFTRRITGAVRVEEDSLLIYTLKLLCQSLKFETLPKRKLSMIAYKLVLLVLGGLDDVKRHRDEARQKLNLPPAADHPVQSDQRPMAKVTDRSFSSLRKSDGAR